MKKIGNFLAICILLIWSAPLCARAAEQLVPVGQVVGLQLQNETVTVASLDDSAGDSNRGLQVGDRLLAIDGKPVSCAEDVKAALQHSDGTVELRISRSGREESLRVKPRITPTGPKIGVYLREGVTGIGTITFYDPESGMFGTLGHGVNDENGSLLAMKTGSAYPASVMSVKKGRTGQPGQLMGALSSNEALGSLHRNTDRGVFGEAAQAFSGEPVPVGGAETVRTGSAVIRSTIQGTTVQEYSVDILKIYPKDRANGRNLLIKVTDPVLLETTGGIVQGMSGSPIIQDGHIVGAVTHVLVNDPTTGYGIFIENMLDAAG